MEENDQKDIKNENNIDVEKNNETNDEVNLENK